MDLIDSVNDLQKNLDTFDSYGDGAEGAVKEFYKDLIKRGRCFVVYTRGSKTRYAPSRFIGYRNNDMKSHLANAEKDGRDTNPAIDKIIGKRSEQDRTMELQYQRFCNHLGIEPWKTKKKFWTI